MESVNPAVVGEDIPEPFARLVQEADPGAYVSLDSRTDPARMLAFDGWVLIEPLLNEFLKPYVAEAIKARPIIVKVDDPDGAAERRRIIAYLGRRRTDGLDSITLATLIGELGRGEHLNIAEMKIAADPR